MSGQVRGAKIPARDKVVVVVIRKMEHDPRETSVRLAEVLGQDVSNYRKINVA